MNQVNNLNNSQIERRITQNITILDYNKDITTDVSHVEMDMSINSLSRGYIIYEDNHNNVFKTIPLIGGEYVLITLLTPQSEVEIMSKMFQISNIEIIDRQVPITNSKNKFKINLVSPLILQNATSKISKGYSTPKTTN